MTRILFNTGKYLFARIIWRFVWKHPIITLAGIGFIVYSIFSVV